MFRRRECFERLGSVSSASSVGFSFLSRILSGGVASSISRLNRCLAAGSFNPLDEYKGWRLQLVSVGALVVCLFLFECGSNLFSHKTIYLVDEQLFLLVLLDPLFHVSECLRNYLTVELEFNFLPLDSFTLLHNFDREEPGHFVALFDLLQFLLEHVLNLFDLIKPLIHVRNPLGILLFIIISLLVQDEKFRLQCKYFIVGLVFQLLDLLFDVSYNLLLF